MSTIDFLSDPRQRLDWMALLENGFFGNDLPILPGGTNGVAPSQTRALESFLREQGIDGDDFAPELRDLQADLLEDPKLLEQLNQIRQQLGLPSVDNPSQLGLQDPSALMGEDLVALMVMWALQQSNQNRGGGGQQGQMHPGLPQQRFSNVQPTSWNPSSGGGGGGSSGGGGGTSHAGHSHGGGSSATGGGNPAPTAVPGGPVPDVPADIGPVVPGQNGVPAGLNENAARGAAMVRQVFGFDGTIGGIGQRSGPSDHPHGNAIDVMTNENMEQGQQIADFFRANHDELGVKYVIFNQRIASERTGWQWEAMEDRGSPTANHLDHPHISFHGPE